MNLRANKKKVLPPLSPIKVIDIELSSTLPSFRGLGDYRGLQALVRLHGRPLGYIGRPVTAGSCSAPDLKKAILSEHCGDILRHLLYNRLAVPLASDRLRIEDLIKEPCAGDNHRSLPVMTIAVCTRDRSNYLPLCLDSLNRLEYPHLDLLVVDNAPRDDSTERLVRTIHPNVRYVREPRPGLNWARNRAIIEARGEVIAYADDDVVADPGWAKALVGHFMEDPEIMAITGLVAPYELETEAQVLFEKRGGFGKGFKRRWYPENLVNGTRVAHLYSNAGQFGTGANMAFRRCLFNRIGHFDPALDVGTPTRGGGDLEMFFRVLKEGGVLLYEPGAIARHRHRRSKSELRIQWTDWGSGFIAYLLRSGLAYPDERSAFIRKGLWFYWWLSIENPMRSVVGPPHLPLNVILGQTFSSLTGPIRYLMGRFSAARIERTFGPLSQTLISDPPEFARQGENFREKIGVFDVSLGQPLPALSEAADYSSVRIEAYWKGRQLDTFEIPNSYHSISASRLREAVVDRLGLRLMDLDCKKSLDELRAETYTALIHNFMSTDDGT